MVYGITGRQVATMVNGPMNAGIHTQTFDASLGKRRLFLLVRGGGSKDVQKMMLVANGFEPQGH